MVDSSYLLFVHIFLHSDSRLPNFTTSSNLSAFKGYKTINEYEYEYEYMPLPAV